MNLPLAETAVHTRKRHAQTGAQWWRGAVIYQIYPRSFKDSNGDGIGDLRGCIEGLDYIASLGVDGVWISPFFTSPMKDFGYDVADYCDVDPVFGTLKDFDELIAKAHRLGLKVIIDQVYSHTSDAHPWFQQSRQGRHAAKADWYVWADARADGGPPNNWLSVFGGPAWSWDEKRQQYYLHNFLPSQPDLNVRNMAVQDALLDVARFWLERGVDGFRLDAINFAMHDPLLRDNPPAPPKAHKPVRAYDTQSHIYNQSHADIPAFLERIRAVTDRYGAAFTVAEVGGPEPLAEMKEFTRGGKRLNSAYSFDFLYADALTAQKLKDTLLQWSGEADEGWPSWAFSNHDAPRALSRWHDGADPVHYAKMTAMLLLSLRGNAFLYQGEELGLEQAQLTFEQLKDPEAIANWPQTLGRDGARTPLPWSKEDENAGFSTGQPWLPIDPRHRNKAISEEEKDPASVLNLVRAMIRLRHQSKALRLGSLSVLPAPEPVFALIRAHRDERLLCAFNLGADSLAWPLPHSADASLLLQNRPGHEHLDRLEPFGALIARLAPASAS